MNDPIAVALGNASLLGAGYVLLDCGEVQRCSPVPEGHQPHALRGARGLRRRGEGRHHGAYFATDLGPPSQQYVAASQSGVRSGFRPLVVR